MYDAATVADIYEAYNRLGLSDQEIYTCTGVSGESLGGENQQDEEQQKQLEAARAIAEASQNGNLFEASATFDLPPARGVCSPRPCTAKP